VQGCIFYSRPVRAKPRSLAVSESVTPVPSPEGAAWHIPVRWLLRAEMVFGGIASPAAENLSAKLRL